MVTAKPKREDGPTALGFGVPLAGSREIEPGVRVYTREPWNGFWNP